MSESAIHPTAIIDAAAEIAEGVRIGPYCVIRGKVVIGEGTELLNHVTIDGSTEIGRDNLFYPGAVIGGKTQDLKYDGEPTYLKIGDHNTFREYVTVNRASIKNESTVIGSHGNFHLCSGLCRVESEAFDSLGHARSGNICRLNLGSRRGHRH